MKLNKVKLGRFIRQSDARNTELLLGEEAVVGISTQKDLIPTKANLSGVNLSSYKVVNPGEFVYVPDTSRRGDKIALALNSTSSTLLVSAIYTVFYIHDTDNLLSDYLFMFFNRPEFDRYARTNSWGSARETFNWEDMCDIELDLPDLPTQQKYVAIYKAMQANQQSYERGLDDLKLVCEGFIKELRQSAPVKALREYIVETNVRNDVGLTLDAVRGLATSKEMIPTKADMNGVSLKSYKVVNPRQIAYVPDTSRRGDKVSLGFNDSKDCYLVSSISTVFETDHQHLLPEYLMLFLTRPEFDRYARYNSWGSARETFTFDDLGEMKIPIPSIDIQHSIAEIFAVYKMRNAISEQLKSQLSTMCPILIRGSLSDGG